CYFTCATLGVAPLFYGLQIAAGTGTAILGLRAWRDRAWPWSVSTPPAIDWLLMLLVAASLLSTLRYKIPFQTVSGNDGKPRTAYVLFPDMLYDTGMAYQLAQGLPPPQCSTRGGSPERAYHHFPFVTCVLLADYTGQADRLRVQLAYYYTVVEILMCLALFSLARRLTGERWPGYAAIALVYLLPFEGPELVGNCLHLFYFTILPQATSGLIPVASTSAPMYGGLALLYGVVLAVAQSWGSQAKGTVSAVLGLLMAAAMARFRLYIFLVMFPGVFL